MICAYCGKEKPPTREHIIPNSVLSLFPECFLTIDEPRGVVHQNDPLIKDVCAECNNARLAYIDCAAKQLVQDYCKTNYKMDEELLFEYDLSLIQKVCLKIAFNDLRSRKDRTDFFTAEIREYLLNCERTEPLSCVTILAGLAVNTSPVPRQAFGNKKICWGSDPILLSNSIIFSIDYETGQYALREGCELQSFEGLSLSYLIRLNSIQLLIFCWDHHIQEEQVKTNNTILDYQYPYTRLTPIGESLLTRCTSELTYHLEKAIDVTWGQSLMDEISYMRGTFTADSQEFYSELEKWAEEEERLAALHPRKR